MKASANKTSFWRRFSEPILYLLFGGLTTLLSVLLYWGLTRILKVNYYSANILSWIGAVSFAYITNKVIVFSNSGHFLKKAAAFVAARLFSLIVEMVIMYVMIELMKVNDLLSKVIVQMIVIILNYVLSKFAIFRKDR